MPSSVHYIIFIEALAILGIIVSILGYRLIKLTMFLAGSFFGFSIVYVFSPSVIHAKYCCSAHGNKEVHIIASLLSGVIIGLLVSRLYIVGLFILGKCFGLLIAVLILQTPLNTYFHGIVSIGSFLGTTTAIVGSLTIKYEKTCVIISTSFVGTYAALCGFEIFFKSPFSHAVSSVIVYFKEVISYGVNQKLPHKAISFPHYKIEASLLSRNGCIMFVCWFVWSFICCLIQLRITARNIEGGGNLCPCDVSTKSLEEHCFGRKKEKETVYFYLDGEKWREVAK